MKDIAPITSANMENVLSLTAVILGMDASVNPDTQGRSVKLVLLLPIMFPKLTQKMHRLEHRI